MPGRRFPIALAIVILGALCFSSGAQACSCVELAPRAALRQSDAAITGRLIRVEPVGRYGADYVYRIGRVYKRGPGLEAGGTVVVRSAVDGAACGLPDDRARWYGLFLGRSDGLWRGGLCGITTPRKLTAAAKAERRGDSVEASAAGSADCAS